MKLRTCVVSADCPRVDLEYDGILFRGAALHGAGGVMGASTVEGWVDIGPRFRILRARKEMLRVYTILAPDKEEFFDAPAAQCELRAIYAPRYETRR